MVFRSKIRREARVAGMSLVESLTPVHSWLLDEERTDCREMGNDRWRGGREGRREGGREGEVEKNIVHMYMQ